MIAVSMNDIYALLNFNSASFNLNDDSIGATAYLINEGSTYRKTIIMIM